MIIKLSILTLPHQHLVDLLGQMQVAVQEDAKLMDLHGEIFVHMELAASCAYY